MSHNIDDLVRLINAETFSDGAHGAGHRVVFKEGQATIYRRRWLEQVFSARTEKQFFVKTWIVPKEVAGWMFRWSEGTNAISIELEATFVIQANEDAQALRLVEATGTEGTPGEVLHGLINAALDTELRRMLADCNRRSTSLLAEFGQTSLGLGTSEPLNDAVSKAVAGRIGCHFRIGFRLKNAPPLQIEVSRVGTDGDEFTLADSKRRRRAETTALLRLDNYQAYKKSGLQTEKDVRETIGSCIAQAVKQLLFAQRYYDVVRSFAPGNVSVASRMRERIEQEAKAIGFSLQMFQTFPDVEALRLLEPFRVDVPPDPEKKYFLRNAVGYVQFTLALTVKMADDISKLHLLLEPDAVNVTVPLVERIRQVCRDTVQRFDHQDFNLNFDTAVAPDIRSAVIADLASFGLQADIINVRQEPTDEGLRFRAIRGRTIDFKADVKPQANLGEADVVPIAGTIQVVGMTANGWPAFESKDFGFRTDSQFSPERMLAMAEGRLAQAPRGVPSSDEDRHALAVDLELAEVRDRVVATLEAAMSMGPDLARHWTSAANSKRIGEWAQALASDAIASEFGLSIALRGFRRLDTDTDITAKIERGARHQIVRESAQEEARIALEYEKKKRDVLDRNELSRYEELGRREIEALGDPLDPEHESVLERAKEEAAKAGRSSRLTPDRAASRLRAPSVRSKSNQQALPWEPVADRPPHPDDDGSTSSGSVPDENRRR